MAIPFDVGSQSSTASASSLTWSHTVTNAHQNLMLAVFVAARKTVTGVTYNGVSLTQGDQAIIGEAGPYVYLYYLLAPSTGTHNIVISTSVSTEILGAAASYYNIQQTGTFGTFVHSSNSSGNSSNTVTTTSTNQFVLDGNADFDFFSNATTTVSASQTVRADSNGRVTVEAVLADKAATGSAMTLTWTNTFTAAQGWGQISVAVNTGIPVTKDLAMRGRVAPTVYKDLAMRGRVAVTNFKDLQTRASVTEPHSTGYGSQYVYKTQMVMVYNASGTFLDTWYDAPILAGFKEQVNATPEQLEVPLPRAFANPNPSGRPSTIAFGNVVKYYLFGPGLASSGYLRYTGVIDGWKAEITEQGEETITVTLTSQASSTVDQAITSNVTQSNQDPVTTFNNLFSTTNPVTGGDYFSPLSWSAGNPGSSGNSDNFTFSDQRLATVTNTLRLQLPTNWFIRYNPDTTTTVNVPPVSAQHTFTVGKDITTPQYAQDWSQLRNNIQVQGATNVSASPSVSMQFAPSTSSSTSIINHFTSSETASTSVTIHTDGTFNASTPLTASTIRVNATSSDISTYGQKYLQYYDNRITTTSQANAIAQGLLNQYDQVPLRATIRVPDYRGDTQSGLGYDIETILVGDSCQIVDPDPRYAGGISTVVTTITSLTYGFDYVDLELGTPQPSQQATIAGQGTTTSTQFMSAPITAS